MKNDQTSSDPVHLPVIAGASTSGLGRGIFAPMKTYSEKLKDPRWQRKRLEIMQRDNFTCTGCGSKDKTLNVHHWQYSGGYPWETPNEYLSTLCEDCHQGVEIGKKGIRENFVLNHHRWAVEACLRFLFDGREGIGPASQALRTDDGDVLLFGGWKSLEEKARKLGKIIEELTDYREFVLLRASKESPKGGNQ